MIRLQEGLRVLLIENLREDKDDFFQLLKECKIESAEFTAVDNFHSAMMHIKNNTPDIIFSGILPGNDKDNDKELQEFRLRSNIPLITLSRNEDASNSPESLSSIGDDHLYKNELTTPLLKKSIQYCLERSKKNAELKEIVDRFELLAKATNDIVWDWELTKRRALWMGNGIQTNLGYSHRMIKVDTDFWEKGLHPEDIGRVTSKLENIFKNARINKWEDEYRFKTAKGDYRTFYDRGYIIYEDGKPVRMIGTMEDITERVLLERKLEQETLLKQKQIAEAVVTAQENERTEIGKELHDNVNQLLSASKLYIDAAANDIANNE